jgi:hypothetical protein
VKTRTMLQVATDHAGELRHRGGIPAAPAASLDPAVVQSARSDPVARGGRGAEPDQQAGVEDRGGPHLGPPPAPTHPFTRREDQAPDWTTTATEQPAPTLSPERQ